MVFEVFRWNHTIHEREPKGSLFCCLDFVNICSQLKPLLQNLMLYERLQPRIPVLLSSPSLTPHIARLIIAQNNNKGVL